MKRILPLLASLCVLASPALRAADGEPLAFPNAGFEAGKEGWSFSKDDEASGFSVVSPEAAKTDKAGLRVKHPITGPGTWVQCTKIPIEGGKTYRIGYSARCVETSGVGIWVQIYDAEGKVIAPADPKTLISLVPQEAKEWADYRFDVVAPANAANLSLAVHAFSKHACLADFDDFSVVPQPKTITP